MDIDMVCISIQQHDIGVRLKNQLGYIPEKLFFFFFSVGKMRSFQTTGWDQFLTMDMLAWE